MTFIYVVRINENMKRNSIRFVSRLFGVESWGSLTLVGCILTNLLESVD